MNKTARLALIKSKLGQCPKAEAKPKGIHLAAHPELGERVKRKELPRSGGEWVLRWQGGYEHPNESRKAWVFKPDKPPKKQLGPKPRREPHALTKITEKWIAPKANPPC